MVRSELPQDVNSSVNSIGGGFVPVSVACLMAAWRACQISPLRIADFRAWLAAHELKGRRCIANRDRSPTYTIIELASLLGVSQRAARASLRRLRLAGLIEWSEAGVRFPEPNTPPEGLDDTIGGGKDSVAIPRRLLKYLAAGARASLIAVALAVLLRCLSRRRHGWEGRGRVKASWISTTFGIDLSRVKLARAELVKLGWIVPQESHQWAMNRWGKVYLINLSWVAPRADRSASGDGRKSPPLRPPGGTESLPPDLQTPIPFGRLKDQEPARGLAGFSIEGTGSGEREEAIATTSTPTVMVPDLPPKVMTFITMPTTSTPSAPSPAPCQPATPSRHPIPLPAVSTPVIPLPAVSPGRASTPSSSTPVIPLPAVSPGRASTPSSMLPAPKLADVRLEDLKQTGRLLELHRQAIDQRLISPSEADRLRFVGVAEHALAIGKSNPCGLFMYLVRGGLWRFLTGDDEDRANRRIKAFLRGPALPPPLMGLDGGPTHGQSIRPILSADAIKVREVRRALEAAGYRGPAFPQLHRIDASFTRERWDQAVAELGP